MKNSKSTNSPRVKIIKNNIPVGTSIPKHCMDSVNGVGNWVDHKMAELGYDVDTKGTVDMPGIGVDNKSKMIGSGSAWTQGSITINDIIDTPDLLDTEVWRKMKNQNQVTWDRSNGTVTSTELVNMDIEETREMLRDAWRSVRRQILNGARDKTITSSNKALSLDGYNSDTSYRVRISNAAMKKIRNRSRTKQSMDNLFEFEAV